MYRTVWGVCRLMNVELGKLLGGKVPEGPSKTVHPWCWLNHIGVSGKLVLSFIVAESLSHVRLIATIWTSE